MDVIYRDHNQRMRSEGQRHQKPRGKVPYKGVTIHRPSGRYQARISVFGRRRQLGYFDTPDAAARAYDRVYYSLLHGRRGNFPLDDYPDLAEAWERSRVDEAARFRRLVGRDLGRVQAFGEDGVAAVTRDGCGA